MPDDGHHAPGPRPHRPPDQGAARPSAASASLDPAAEELLADLVERVLILARGIRYREYPNSVIFLDGMEAMVMYYIDRHPGASPSEVARACGLQRSNLSTTVRSLEGRGMVERRLHPADARQVRLFPTPMATENFRRVRAEWASVVAADLSAPYEGLTETVGMLSRLTQGLVTR